MGVLDDDKLEPLNSQFVSVFSTKGNNRQTGKDRTKIGNEELKLKISEEAVRDPQATLREFTWADLENYKLPLSMLYFFLYKILIGDCQAALGDLQNKWQIVEVA